MECRLQLRALKLLHQLPASAIGISHVSGAPSDILVPAAPATFSSRLNLPRRSGPSQYATRLFLEAWSCLLVGGGATHNGFARRTRAECAGRAPSSRPGRDPGRAPIIP